MLTVGDGVDDDGFTGFLFRLPRALLGGLVGVSLRVGEATLSAADRGVTLLERGVMFLLPLLLPLMLPFFLTLRVSPNRSASMSSSPCHGIINIELHMYINAMPTEAMNTGPGRPVLHLFYFIRRKQSSVSLESEVR